MMHKPPKQSWPHAPQFLGSVLVSPHALLLLSEPPEEPPLPVPASRQPHAEPLKQQASMPPGQEYVTQYVLKHVAANGCQSPSVPQRSGVRELVPGAKSEHRSSPGVHPVQDPFMQVGVGLEHRAVVTVKRSGPHVSRPIASQNVKPGFCAAHCGIASPQVPALTPGALLQNCELVHVPLAIQCPEASQSS
jgi:hypothetical protein